MHSIIHTMQLIRYVSKLYIANDNYSKLMHSIILTGCGLGHRGQVHRRERAHHPRDVRVRKGPIHVYIYIYMHITL